MLKYVQKFPQKNPKKTPKKSKNFFFFFIRGGKISTAVKNLLRASFFIISWPNWAKKEHKQAIGAPENRQGTAPQQPQVVAHNCLPNHIPFVQLYIASLGGPSKPSQPTFPLNPVGGHSFPICEPLFVRLGLLLAHSGAPICPFVVHICPVSSTLCLIAVLLFAQLAKFMNFT